MLAMFVSPIASACSQGRTQFSILNPAKSSAEELGTEIATVLTQRAVFAEPLAQQLQVPGQMPERVDAELKLGQLQKRAAMTNSPLIALAENSNRQLDAPLSVDENVSRIRRTELLLTGIWLAGILVLGGRVFVCQFSM